MRTMLSHLLIATTLLVASGVHAEVPVPALVARVTDQTRTLSAEQTQNIEQTLQAFEERKGSQIAVLVVASTAPETIEQYSLRVAEQWKLGRKKVDDGALLIVAKNDRALRIEVGYGLEGALNDAASKRIISEVIVPRFAEGDFYAGIRDGIDRMIRVVDGEPLPPPSQQIYRNESASQYAPVLLILAFVVGGFLHSMLGRVPGAVAAGGIIGVIGWLAAGAVSVAAIFAVLTFLFTLLAGGMVWPFLGSMMRGGHRGGFRGGGFGGGGGRFGGGGASGRW